MATYLTSRTKHVVVLSPSGKPAFSRTGSEWGDDGLAVCATLRALAARTRDEIASVELSVVGSGGASDKARLVFLKADADVLLVLSLIHI